jgi:hypothetical protein
MPIRTWPIRTRLISSLLTLLLCDSTFALNDMAYAASELPSSPYRQQAEMPTVKNQKRYGKVSHTRKRNEHEPPLIEKYLIEGRFLDGETALTAELKQHNNDDQLRFGLGMLQFLQAIERLMQDFYRYGAHDPFGGFHNFEGRFPLPFNPAPERLTYIGARKIAETFLENLSKSETTLSEIKDPDVQLPLHFGMIRLDLDNNDKIDEDETLWKLYSILQTAKHIKPSQAERFIINFDRGDVHWLRGYCHLLMAFTEIYLAYDTKESFDSTAHIFFSRVDSPYNFLNQGVHAFGKTDNEFGSLVDLVACVHLIRWAVVEPKRMEEALHHLEAVTAQSKESWKWILAETDDDREWLPNPKQTGVIPGFKVKEEMIVAWTDAMDEIQKLLAGELVIPFWRGHDGRGVNLRRVFLEPRTLDAVLWVQGSAAIPYLETGKLCQSGTWSHLPGVFGDHFPGFAMWFN